MPQTERQQTGAWGEETAVSFLISHGYTMVDRNYRTKFGEVDIIATFMERRFGKTLAFIEVKTRSQKHITGLAERAVGKQKRLRIFRAAQGYCVTHGINIDKTPIQFEQVSVYKEAGQVVCRKYVLPPLSS